MSHAAFQRLSSIYGGLLDYVVKHRGYCDMPTSQRIFFHIMTADGSINNGGIDSLWFNDFWTIPLRELPCAFREIDAPKSAAVIESFTRSWLIRVPPLKSIRIRSYEMAFLSLFWPCCDALSAAYYATDEDIDDLLLSYFQAREPEFQKIA